MRKGNERNTEEKQMKNKLRRKGDYNDTIIFSRTI